MLNEKEDKQKKKGNSEVKKRKVKDVKRERDRVRERD